MFFSYQTTDNKVFCKIEENLTKLHWKTHKKSDTKIILTKTLLSGKGELNFVSLEITKVSLKNATICVGYLQADSFNNTNINSRFGEMDWANKNFWPKYLKCKENN